MGWVLAIAKDDAGGSHLCVTENAFGQWALWTRVLGNALFSCLLSLKMAQEGSYSPVSVPVDTSSFITRPSALLSPSPFLLSETLHLLFILWRLM